MEDAPGKVLCRIGALGGAATAAVTIIFDVESSVTGTWQHTAEVAGEQVDPDPRNNRLVESIPVLTGAKD